MNEIIDTLRNLTGVSLAIIIIVFVAGILSMILMAIKLSFCKGCPNEDYCERLRNDGKLDMCERHNLMENNDNNPALGI